MGSWFDIFEIIGIVSFSISGAIVAARKHFDLFGVIVLGVTTALGGGVIRDIILGLHPPIMFVNFSYSLIAVIVSFCVFIIAYFKKDKLKFRLEQIEKVLKWSDAIGLGTFVVIGVNTSFFNGYEENGFLVVFVGVMTGIGGGIIRDIMVGQIPFILHKRIYAVAAIAGAVLYYMLFQYGMQAGIAASISIATTIIIQMTATYFDLDLPRI